MKEAITKKLMELFPQKKYQEVLKDFVATFKSLAYPHVAPYLVEDFAKKLKSATKNKAKIETISTICEAFVKLLIENQPELANGLKVGDVAFLYNGSKVTIEFICDNDYVVIDDNEKKTIQYAKLLSKENFDVTEKVYSESASFLDNFNFNTLSSDLFYVLNMFFNNEVNQNPFYQRGFIWTDEQKRAYIEAIFLKKAKIHFAVIWNNYQEMVKSGFDSELLDGKQRMSAILEFVTGKFTIFDNLSFFNLAKEDKFFFLRHKVTYDQYEKRDGDFTREDKINLFLGLNAYNTLQEPELINKLKYELGEKNE